MAKFEIIKDAKGEFRFNLKAGNGRVILRSEGYSAKTSCNNGIESVRKNSMFEERFEVKASTNGKHYFNLKATNGQVIGSSELYETEAALRNGIASVKENAKDAMVSDLSV